MESLLMPYSAVECIPAQSVLVFAPHPDDEVFGCGGAILRHREAGVPVQVIVISDGAYGAKDEVTRGELAKTREQESQQAARILKCTPPIFWNYKDRGISYCEELIDRIKAAILETKADLIYTPSLLEMHPDHRAVAMATLEAIRRLNTGIRIAMYEIGIPIRPNLLVDITDVWLQKAQAMACFKSQLKIQAYDEHITGLNRYRTYTLGPNSRYAEAYCLIEPDTLQRDFLSIYESEYEKQARLALPLPLLHGHMPKVSVLIRSMDRPELKDALDSVALQTYSNIEVILVNAKGPGHKRPGGQCGRFPLHFLDSERPLSRSEAGNLAMEHASGEFLIFLDDDDIFLPDHIHTLVSSLMAHSEKRAAYTAIAAMDANRTPLTMCFDSPFDSILLLAGNCIPIHAVMFSRQLLQAGCRLDEGFDLYEDWDLWIQVSRHTDFLFIPKITAYYRMTTHSGKGIRPDSQRMYQAGRQIFEKWRGLWTKEILEYVTRRIETSKINPGLLQAAQEAFDGPRATEADENTSLQTSPISIAVVLHLFYLELWPEIHQYLKNIPVPFDLFITVPVEQASQIKDQITGHDDHIHFFPMENRGRDILPFLTVLPELIRQNYLCVCKIHTKRSRDAWRNDLLQGLLGSEQQVQAILQRFQKDSRLGILGPDQHYISCAMYPDAHMDRLKSLAEQLMPGCFQQDWHFFGGSMFWFRPAALLPILGLSLSSKDFEPESGQKEGTLAHILERLFTISAKAAGFEVETINSSTEKTRDEIYPFTPQSTWDLMREKNSLLIQLKDTISALQQAEQLAIERLNQLQLTENALKNAEQLAIERFETIQNINQQLNRTENALKNAEQLAIERLNIIHKLSQELDNYKKYIQVIKQHWTWRILTKLNIIPDNHEINN